MAGDDGDGADGVESVLEPFVDAVRSFLRCVERAGRRGRDRWDQTSVGTKIALWLPLQAVLFEVQPILWGGLEYALLAIGRGIAATTNGVARMDTQSQLILLLVGLFEKRTVPRE